MRSTEAKRVYEYKNSELKLFSVANTVTTLRLLMLPLLIYFMLAKPDNYVLLSAASVAFAGLGTTIDGYIARRRNEVTAFGALTDLFTTKYMIIAAMVLLLNAEVAPAIIVILLSSREIYALIVRSMAHERGIVLPNILLTPLKTMLQYLGVLSLIMSLEVGAPLKQIGLGAMILSIALSWTSAFIYTRALFTVLRRRQSL